MNTVSVNRVFLTGIIFFLMIPTLSCQQILILEKTGKFKTFNFTVGNHIMLQVDGEQDVSGKITSLEDSTLQLNNITDIQLSHISIIYRDRSMLQFVSTGAILGGLGYFVLTGFNRSINNENPILPVEDIAVSAAVIGSGIILKQFKYKKYQMNKGWQLKILDFNL